MIQNIICILHEYEDNHIILAIEHLRDTDLNKSSDFLLNPVCIMLIYRVGSHVVFAWIHCTDVRIHCTDILIECRKISLCFLIYTQKVIHHFPAHIFPYQTLPEASSIMRALSSARCTGFRLYAL